MSLSYLYGRALLNSKRSKDSGWQSLSCCFVSLFLLFWLSAEALFAQSQPALKPSIRVAIASAHALATEAGMEIINKGGNVFDAAVAVSAALAVVEPSGSGLGGGGYWLLHRAEDGYETMIDGRETAPLAAHKTMFLNNRGHLVPRLSIDGALAAAIPGMPAALAHLSQHYGRLPLSESLLPAIKYAQLGFVTSPKYLKLAQFRIETLKKNVSAAAIFLSDNRVPGEGWRLIQPDLARTLERLAKFGHAGFYAGEIADKLVNSVNKAGGIWRQQDLQNYRAIERKPVKGVYHGITITSAAPSSSGGLVLVEALNILSGYDLPQLDATTRKHLVIESLRRAYHDRAFYLGDSDFIDLPLERLLNPEYAAGLRSGIRLDKALPSAWLAGETSDQAEGANTTHFSIIDEQGNRVAASLSINSPFGSGFVAEGTGVLLNNEMDDFVSQPGTQNAYGLVGGAANAIAPGKRMLSSMTPTFLEDDTRIAVLGTPGGSRITSMVLLAVLGFAEGQLPGAWVNASRYHHQFIPDVIEYEKPAFNFADMDGLSLRGHQLKETRYPYGDMQAVLWHKQTRALTATSDWRGEGKAWVR